MHKFLLLVLIFTAHLALSQNDFTCQHAKFSTSHAGQHLRSDSNPLMSDYDVKFYGLDLSADNTSIYLEGSATIQAIVTTETLSEFVIELVDVMTVDSVFVNNNIHSFTHENDEISVALNSTLQQNDIFNVTIYYHGDSGQGSGSLSGIFNDISQRWGNQITWTLSEPFGAKVWFPCKQVLSDKADSAHIFITVPDHLMAGSNGLLTNVVELPENRKRYEWKTNYPIAYYLISVTIGSYVIYETYAEREGTDPILIQNFIYDNPDCLPEFQNDLDEFNELLVLYSELYGLYPFHQEKYGNCMAPFSGGMEHQTMTTQGVFNLTLDAHELGHQWFGDNVTCRSWQDIWVNEGFARYSEYLAQENLRSKSEADSWLSGEYSDILSVFGGSVYVPEELAEDEDRIFSFRLTYQKGGALVHMIRNIINNDDVFFDALTTYQQIFKDSTATGVDFKMVLEETSGIDFDAFFDEWYFGEGYPKYNITWNYYGDTLYIDQNQTTSSTVTSLFHTPVEYKVSFEGKDSLFRVAQNSNEQKFKFYMPQEVLSLQIDPSKWLLKKVTGFKKDTYTPDEEEPDEPDTVVTGSEEDKGNMFRVYPNPSSDWLNIDNTFLLSGQITLSDLHGRELLNQHFENQQTIRLNLNTYKAGIYILKLDAHNGVHNFIIRKK